MATRGHILSTREGFFSLRHTIFKESGCDEKGSEKALFDLCGKITVELKSENGVNTGIKQSDISEYFKTYSTKSRGVDLHAMAQYLIGEYPTLAYGLWDFWTFGLPVQ